MYRRFLLNSVSLPFSEPWWEEGKLFGAALTLDVAVQGEASQSWSCVSPAHQTIQCQGSGVHPGVRQRGFHPGVRAARCTLGSDRRASISFPSGISLLCQLKYLYLPNFQFSYLQNRPTRKTDLAGFLQGFTEINPVTCLVRGVHGTGSRTSSHCIE